MTLNVLVMEPNREAREGLKQSLSQALGEIAFGEAKDARTALQAMDQKNVELIVADLEMPGSEGRTFLQKLRSSRGADIQPVVALSDRITPELLMEFKKDPMVWFVQKPAAHGEIADLAGMLLQRPPCTAH
jgi:CheY-like chemotaxis protein